MLKINYKVLIISVLVTLFLGYTLFIYINLPVSDSKMSASADKGKAVWQKYNCNACHQIYGLGGYLGPDLTNEYSQKGEDRILAFLENGTKIMPKFILVREEKDALISFLKHIDSSGQSNPKKFILSNYGSIK